MRSRWSVAPLTLVLVLSGCAGTATAAPTATPTPTPTLASGPTGRHEAIAQVCTELDLVQTTLFNARADHEAHRLDDGEYRAVLNTIPPQVLLAPHGLPATVQRHQDALQREAGTITVGAKDTSIDPDSPALRRALGDLGRDCEAAGFEPGVMATSGG